MRAFLCVSLLANSAQLLLTVPAAYWSVRIVFVGVNGVKRLCLLTGILACFVLVSQAHAQRYARFSYQGDVHFGRVSGESIHLLEKAHFLMGAETGESVSIDDVEWLPPTEAKQVFAVGMNFASHLASRSSAPPPLFLKLPSSLTGHQQPITLPKDAENVHFEGELVLVIGRQAKNVTEEDAPKYIFGATVGNDLTERSWQRSDLQWLRAKATDGFGPVGPFIATDLDYNNVLLTTRLNGKLVQQENTQNMIHSPSKVVSYLSQYITLEPGDLIFMGTPGRTRALHDGDVVSVSIQGIGTLSNTIRAGL